MLQLLKWTRDGDRYVAEYSRDQFEIVFIKYAGVCSLSTNGAITTGGTLQECMDAANTLAVREAEWKQAVATDRARSLREEKLQENQD